MGSSEPILVEQSGRVRRLTLNRPDKLNAMTGAMEDELFERVDDAMGDDGTRVVVLSGAVLELLKP